MSLLVHFTGRNHPVSTSTFIQLFFRSIIVKTDTVDTFPPGTTGEVLDVPCLKKDSLLDSMVVKDTRKVITKYIKVNPVDQVAFIFLTPK